MNIETIKSVYFVGAGGIGMSALIRYFLSKGKFVAGYDRTPSELTGHLIAEGAQIHYEENTGLIPENCKDKESTLVVYTPAIPQEHAELAYFRENGFEIHKRSQVLARLPAAAKDSALPVRMARPPQVQWRRISSTSRMWAARLFSEASPRTTGQTCSYLRPVRTP